jgi:predicted nucleic acid-binding protein
VIVLDASALVDVVLDQPTAPWVLDRITGEEIQCPAHQPAEVLSALARLARAGEIGAETARDALAEAAALPQHLAMPTPSQLDRALALGDRVRVLDGLYVALAEECGCAMVTTDRRLAGSRPPCEVQAPPEQPA